MSITTTSIYIIQQVSIYFGIPLLLVGLLGEVLNVIVFLSLRTFRQSSCAFYLTVMSVVNIGQLLLGLLSRIMISGFNLDWTQSSLFYCKFRYFVLQSCSLISFTCICLAIIDQYFATCSRPHWQRWSHLKVAYSLTTIFAVIWTLHGILYLIFYGHVQSSSTGQVICTIVNSVFSKYNSYGYFFTFTSVLPLSITVVFGVLVYNNIQQLTYRTIPLVRQELDKQLTNMVLKQVIINFFTVLPYTIMSIFSLNVTNANNPDMAAITQCILIVTMYVYYINYASPFYIYICVSERFRRQLMYVLFDIHLNRWRRRRRNVNQVVPQP